MPMKPREMEQLILAKDIPKGTENSIKRQAGLK